MERLNVELSGNPDKALFIAVIAQAVEDILNPKVNSDRHATKESVFKSASRWVFNGDSRDKYCSFKWYCMQAGLNPRYVQDSIIYQLKVPVKSLLALCLHYKRASRVGMQWNG